MADKAKPVGKDNKKVQARRTKDTSQLSKKLEHVLVLKRPLPPPPRGDKGPKQDMLSCVVECYPPVPGGIETASPDAVAIFRNVPQFCFPFDTTHTDIIAPENNEMFTFVLTDGDGIQLFGYCRHLVAPVMHVDGTTIECVCVISYLPWFKLFDQVNAAVTNNRRQWKAAVIPLLDAFVAHPMPLPGERMILRPFGMNGKPFTFDCPDTTRLSAMGESTNLTELFTGLDADRILRLFSSLLLERRVIVTANKLSVITSIVHAATELLYPLYWQHVFIPVVPPPLLDYCAAPMPYIIGVHSSLMKRVRSMPLEEVVIVDVDDNAVAQENNDLEVLPAELVASLRETLKKHTSGIDDVVARVFLKFFVALFGPYRDFIAKGHDGTASFLMEELIMSRPKTFTPFLRTFLSLQMFNQFIDERMHMVLQGKEPQSEFDREAERAKRDGKYLGKRISEKLHVVADKTAEATRQAYDRTKESARRKGQEAIKAVAQRTKAVVEKRKESNAADASPTPTPTATPNATPTAVRPPQRPPPPNIGSSGANPHDNGHHGDKTHARSISVDTGTKKAPPIPPRPAFVHAASQDGTALPSLQRTPSMDDMLSLDTVMAVGQCTPGPTVRDGKPRDTDAPTDSVPPVTPQGASSADVFGEPSSSSAAPVMSPLVGLLPPPPSAARSKREVMADRPPPQRQSPRPPSISSAAPPAVPENTVGPQRAATTQSGPGEAPLHNDLQRSHSSPQAPSVTQPQAEAAATGEVAIPRSSSIGRATEPGSVVASVQLGGGASVAPLAGAIAALAAARAPAVVSIDAAHPTLPPPPQSNRSRRLSNPPVSPAPSSAPPAGGLHPQQGHHGHRSQGSGSATRSFDELVQLDSLGKAASGKAPSSPQTPRTSLPAAPASAEATAALPKPPQHAPKIDPNSVSMESFDPFK